MNAPADRLTNRPVYVAHCITGDGCNGYIEYHDLIIDAIVVPVVDASTGACVTSVRFVRTDPPEHDDLGLPIFRERE